MLLIMIFRYTTDGGTKETLDKGTVPVAAVYSGKVYVYSASMIHSKLK